MSAAARALELINSWETVRYELLNSRICDLGLTVEKSPLARPLERLRRELVAKRIRFRPRAYLTDSWGCPDQVPVIGIPFYLADERLRRIEEEQTGEIEDEREIMALLRHEAGHALNYAYQLWDFPNWEEMFGRFERRYRDEIRFDPRSRAFVRHLKTRSYGSHYAQKHPDEDFAETFAVWLTPQSGWRRKYRGWPALRKLEYVDRLVSIVREREPDVVGGELYRPIEDLDDLLVDHYGQRADRFRATAQGYVDDKLRLVFPPLRRGTPTLAAHRFIGAHRDEVRRCTARWAGLDEEDVGVILDKLEERSRALRLRADTATSQERLLELTALSVALAANFSFTGRLSG